MKDSGATCRRPRLQGGRSIKGWRHWPRNGGSSCCVGGPKNGCGCLSDLKVLAGAAAAGTDACAGTAEEGDAGGGRQYERWLVIGRPRGWIRSALSRAGWSISSIVEGRSSPGKRPTPSRWPALLSPPALLGRAASMRSNARDLSLRTRRELGTSRVRRSSSWRIGAHAAWTAGSTATSVPSVVSDSLKRRVR